MTAILCRSGQELTYRASSVGNVYSSASITCLDMPVSMRRDAAIPLQHGR